MSDFDAATDRLYRILEQTGREIDHLLIERKRALHGSTPHVFKPPLGVCETCGQAKGWPVHQSVSEQVDAQRCTCSQVTGNNMITISPTCPQHGGLLT